MKVMLVRDRNVLNTNWLIYFANLLADSGHEVVIACDTYSKLGELSNGFKVNDGVRVVNLNGKTDNTLVNVYRKVRGKLGVPYFRFNHLIKAEKPDVIVCYFPVDLYNVTRLQNHNIPIIQMVHGYPPMILDKVLKKFLPLKLWCRESFRKVDVFQVLMNSYKNDIDPFFEPKKIVRIANPVKQCENFTDLNNEKKRIIYIARIEKANKRPHLLVEAFNKIAKEFPDWVVDIYGLQKYPEYDKEILDFIKDNGLEKQVFLKGYSKNVYDVYKGADIQGFPSASEGFSLAIADAMAMGIPHIGFSNAHSVNELIVDGHNGFLADDLDGFADKLKALMSDKELRVRMGENARNDMKEFAPENIIAQWNELLKETVSPK